MRLPRRAGLAALLVGAGLLLPGCADQAPTDVPPPATSGPVTSPGASSPTSAAPGASSPAPSSSSSSRPTPTQPSSTGSDEPNRPVETAAPKPLDKPATTAVAQVSLVSMRRATIKAESKLDRSGPGVLVRLKVRNTTAKTLDTSFVQVAVVNDSGAAGALASSRPTDPLRDSVRAGASAEGTYAFVLDAAGSGPLTVQVYVTSGSPVVQFRGRAS